MHLDYQAQLEVKRQRVVDAFERVGGFKGVEVNPCRASSSAFGYRNKIQLPVKGVRGDLKIGLFERGSHDLVDIEACLIHCELGETIFRHVRQLLKDSDIVPYCTRTGKGELRHVLIKSAVKRGHALVVFVTNGEASKSLLKLSERIYHDLPSVKGVVQNINRQRTNVILGKIYKTLVGEGVIEETICDLTFKVSPASFFQVNVRQAEHLYQYVIESLGFSETVVDAYCGVGTMSLLIAQRAKKVIGIESVPEAIQDAKRNAKTNGISNTEFYCESVEQALDQLVKGDVIVLNPPRKGCEPEVIEAIDQSRVIYVSCDPATCARDLKRLEGYEIVSVQPFDMFPQTAHVETVVTLVKKTDMRINLTWNSLS